MRGQKIKYAAQGHKEDTLTAYDIYLHVYAYFFILAQAESLTEFKFWLHHTCGDKLQRLT